MASGRINQVPIVSRHSLNHVWCHRSFPLDREGLSPLRLTSACSCCVAQHPTQCLGETVVPSCVQSPHKGSQHTIRGCVRAHTPLLHSTHGACIRRLFSLERGGVVARPSSRNCHAGLILQSSGPVPLPGACRAFIDPTQREPQGHLCHAHTPQGVLAFDCALLVPHKRLLSLTHSQTVVVCLFSPVASLDPSSDPFKGGM